MNKMDSLEQLRPVADEMLSGLHADERMRLAIRRRAMEKPQPRRSAARFAVPALCAALAVTVGLAALPGLREKPEEDGAAPAVAGIQTLAAGAEMPAYDPELIADLGNGAKVARSSGSGESLFASAKGDIPMLAVNGQVFRLLKSPGSIGNGLLAGRLGEVGTHADEPSLAGGDAFDAGLSNVADEGAAIYAISGIAQTAAVAAEVDGKLRVFQRVSYAGRGPGGLGLEDVFDVRGRVRTLELSGVGTLSGSAANDAAAVLLDQAMLVSADSSARGQTLTATLENGLKFQLTVSGDTVCGCGAWSCPEFFEAFESALE